ncbi:MAG: nitroreductase [Rhodospirillales bacterium]
MKVSDAITSRHSMRVFDAKPVPRGLLEQMIDVSRYAASNGNVQPWKLYVTSGSARQRLSAAIIEAIKTGDSGPGAEYDVYPREFTPIYDQRRKKVGKDLYTLLNVPKGDAEGMQRQFLKNFDFFGAPTGMILTVERRMGNGQWIDCGIFLDNLMLMARELGLHSCPQAAFSRYQHVVRRELAIPADEIVICGLAVGYADAAEVPNNLVTDRAAVGDFTVFIDG